MLCQAWDPIERGLEIQEAWKLGNLEVWRPIERRLEIQEGWKLENLEVWRLGGLEARNTGGLEARSKQQRTYVPILGAYRKQVCWFGRPGS